MCALDVMLDSARALSTLPGMYTIICCADIVKFNMTCCVECPATGAAL